MWILETVVRLRNSNVRGEGESVMLGWDTIQTMLFTILCICFIFYLFMGIYTYTKDKELKVNIKYFALCISVSFWQELTRTFMNS